MMWTHIYSLRGLRALQKLGYRVLFYTTITLNNSQRFYSNQYVPWNVKQSSCTYNYEHYDPNGCKDLSIISHKRPGDSDTVFLQSLKSMITVTVVLNHNTFFQTVNLDHFLLDNVNSISQQELVKPGDAPLIDFGQRVVDCPKSIY